MPLLFPLEELTSFSKFVRVCLGTVAREIDILQEEIVWIHLELGSEIVENTHSDYAHLRMVGRAPGSRGTGVCEHSRVLDVAVRNLENVGKGRRSRSGRPCGAPGFRIPGHE